MNDNNRDHADQDVRGRKFGTGPAEDTPGRNTPTARPDSGEAGGPAGLEPTRYGDWERNGRCIDF